MPEPGKSYSPTHLRFPAHFSGVLLREYTLLTCSQVATQEGKAEHTLLTSGQ